MSTTEAEYRAAAVAAQECVWLVSLLGEIKQETGYKVQLMCDNQSAIKLAENPVFHARTKHIEVHYHFIREKVLKGEIEMKWIDTESQIVDVFTKNLSQVKMVKLCEDIGLTQVNDEREY